MNLLFPNDELARAHEVFRQNHEAGRRRLLETLAAECPATVNTRKFSMRRVLGEITSLRSAGSPASVIGKLALAAVVLAALTLGLYSQLGDRRAYALEDMPGRLLEVRSIYMSGWLFGPDFVAGPNEPRPKYPLTVFAERPNCYWHNTYSFSGPDKNHKEARVSSAYAAGSGRERLYVNSQEKVTIVSNVPPLVNELATENLFQTYIPGELLQGDIGEFAKTGSETVNNTRCDVYERSHGTSKSRLWLDPKTGLPVKLGLYAVDETGKESPDMIIDHVEVNVSASAKGLSFAPPEGYETKRGKAAENPSLIGCGSGSSGSLRLARSHGLNIDGKAVLVCWSYYSVSEDEEAREEQVEFVLAQNPVCDHVEMATIEVDEKPWKWSLVFPKKEGDHIGDDTLSLILHSPKGGTLILVGTPLRLPADRLPSVVEELQRISKTVPPGSKPFSLDMLRTRLADQQ